MAWTLRTFLPVSYLYSGQIDSAYSGLLLVRPLSVGALRPPAALSYCEAFKPHRSKLLGLAGRFFVGLCLGGAPALFQRGMAAQGQNIDPWFCGLQWPRSGNFRPSPAPLSSLDLGAAGRQGRCARPQGVWVRSRFVLLAFLELSGRRAIIRDRSPCLVFM